MKHAYALMGLVVHHAVLSIVVIEIFVMEMVFPVLQMFALVMKDMKELIAPIVVIIIVTFLVFVLSALIV